ncbi:membrane protein, partial [Rhodococcus sp. IITR03]
GGEQAATATAVLVAPSDPIADPDAEAEKERRGTAKAFAMLVPLAYLAFIVYLMLGKFTEVVPPLQGGDAAAIVGGIAALILFAAAASTDRGGFLETTSDHLVDGLVFAFKAMGCVLPIAGFFFIGNPEFAGPILGISADAAGPAILFDLVTTVQSHLPQNAFITSFGILLIGLVAGLDGSGFSGLPLTGALSGALGPAVDVDPSTLAAIGQMGNIWAGGGVIIAWSSLVAVAGFARVPVLDLARKCFLPVMAGLILSTVFAVLVF